MRPTASCFEKGFFGRSVDEFQRLARIALKGEALHRPTRPYVLAAFHEPDSVKDLKIICDYQAGGFSKAKIDWVPPSAKPSPTENSKGHIRFHGSISTQLPPDDPEIHRSGYAAFRTRDRGATIFGQSLWDIDPFDWLALRIKSDGRRYFVNLQTESIVPTDIHQHRLYARRPGEWETVLINWNEFVRTNHGVVVEPKSELMRQKVRTIGIGLIDGVQGPYDLSVERIWATNEMQKEEIREDGREEQSQLKNKHGENIKWRAEWKQSMEKSREENK